VGPRDSLDAREVRRKIPSPCRESNPDRPARGLVAELSRLRIRKVSYTYFVLVEKYMNPLF